MRLAAAALALALSTQAGHAQSVEWTATPGQMTDTIYACGPTCAEQQAVCAHFVQSGSKGLRVEYIADEALMPWGQIDYSVAAMVFQDRQSGAPAPTTGAREAGPDVVSFADKSWVQTEYRLADMPHPIDITVLMWPVKSELQGLRCSFVADDGMSEAIEDLAASLR